MYLTGDNWPALVGVLGEEFSWGTASLQGHGTLTQPLRLASNDESLSPAGSLTLVALE